MHLLRLQSHFSTVDVVGQLQFVDTLGHDKLADWLHWFDELQVAWYVFWITLKTYYYKYTINTEVKITISYNMHRLKDSE